MCGPCKIILDAGVAAMFEEGGQRVEAAMAKAAADVLYQLDSDVQNRMSELDAWALNTKAEGEAVSIVAGKWRSKMLSILAGVSGLKLDGSA